MTPAAEVTLLIGSWLHAFLFFSGSRTLQSPFRSHLLSVGNNIISEQLMDTDSQQAATYRDLAEKTYCLCFCASGCKFWLLIA